jgi:hypothetical protein
VRPIDKDDVADPGDLRTWCPAAVSTIVAVRELTLWLTAGPTGTLAIQWQDLRPTYSVWRPQCEG